MTNGVEYEPVSSWQKPDCINNSDDHTCKRPATLEAVLGRARIRCCDYGACKERAAEIAMLAQAGEA